MANAQSPSSAAGSTADMQRHHDVDRLAGQIYVVGAARVHPGLGYGPHRGFEIDLIPRCIDQFALAHHRQQNEAQGEPDSRVCRHLLQLSMHEPNFQRGEDAILRHKRGDRRDANLISWILDACVPSYGGAHSVCCIACSRWYLELPARPRTASVKVLSGYFHDAWAGLPAERVQTDAYHFADSAEAVLALDDGHELHVLLVGIARDMLMANTASGNPGRRPVRRRFRS
ncbi:hypothetical protein BO443_20006 [Burkholderia orbicola]